MKLIPSDYLPAYLRNRDPAPENRSAPFFAPGARKCGKKRLAAGTQSNWLGGAVLEIAVDDFLFISALSAAVAIVVIAICGKFQPDWSADASILKTRIAIV